MCLLGAALVEQTVEDLEASAAFARNELAWQIALQFSLKTYQRLIQERAASAMLWPNDYREYMGARRALLRAVSQGGPKPSDHPGHYLNKAALVYMMSLMDAFLQDVHRVLYDKSAGRMTFGPLTQKIGERVEDFYESQPTRRIRLLALIRNRVVHGRGEVTQEFLDEAAPLAASWPGMPDRFNADFLLGEQVCLGVQKIILPGLEYGMDFVDATVAMVARTGNASDTRAP